MKGAFAIAIIFKNLNLLAGSRKGSPLALGISDNSTFLGSDSVALAPFTKKIIFWRKGDSVFIKENSYQIFNEKFRKVKRQITLSNHSNKNLDKGNFNHFMQKEIYEQPHIIGDSLTRFLDPINKKINIPDVSINWKKIKKINLIACGTSYYACQVATYWIEKYAKINATAHLASEFRYKSFVDDPKETLAIFISQSGETADTLAALKFVKKINVKY